MPVLTHIQREHRIAKDILLRLGFRKPTVLELNDELTTEQLSFFRNCVGLCTLITRLALVVLIFATTGPQAAIADSHVPSKPTVVKPDYEQLEKQCLDAVSAGCCLASVKRMKAGSFLLSTAKTLRDTKCPEGYRADTLRCKGSFRWCAPVKVQE